MQSIGYMGLRSIGYMGLWSIGYNSSLHSPEMAICSFLRAPRVVTPISFKSFSVIVWNVSKSTYTPPKEV